MLSIYAQTVAQAGLAESNRMMVDRVPRGSRVLDVGCSAGYLAEPLLQQRGCRHVDGIEINPGDAAQARAGACRQVVEGSADDAATYARLAGPYDVVLFGDVLEHLRDPGQALRAARPLIAPGGVAIASVPNIAHLSIRLGLLRGHFDYADWGILDRTHLRFFTKQSLYALCSEAGYAVRSCEPTLQMGGRLFEMIDGRLARRVARRFDRMLAVQFIIVAAPLAPGAGPS